MEVICVSQRDILRLCAQKNSDEINPPSKDRPVELSPWINKQLLDMKNEVLIRASGGGTAGQKGDCRVVFQDKFNWKQVPLRSFYIKDHISLDKTTSVLSFTYAQIDMCVDNFLMDWERIFMMTNLARQVSSKWLQKYKEDLIFEPFDTQELKFTYAKEFVCSIQWDTSEKGRPRQPVLLRLSLIRNPHARVVTYLQSLLNDNFDLIYFVQVLFKTLPLMSCLEEIEVACTQRGDIGKLSIIPRAVDAVRIVYSSMHALDIRFIDALTLCVSDAAFHSSVGRNEPTVRWSAPQPYISPLAPTSANQAIKVSQQLTFAPSVQFDELLQTLDEWIFLDDIRSVENSWYASNSSWEEKTEPHAVPFQHGFLCSTSLCPTVLHRLQTLDDVE
ncbi:hypothetical protein BDF14DRAFT_108002 [Spinellus fusiger]|nr:hypothetical protein BDF14DRAFT_108002 [Spinellus fusiger]